MPARKDKKGGGASLRPFLSARQCVREMSTQNNSYVCGVCSDDAGKKIIDGIHVMSISPRPRARMIKHPVETGRYYFDNKVLEPTVIDVNCRICWEDRKCVDDIYEMWATRTYKFYSVIGRTKVWKRLSLVSCPDREVPAHFDVFDFTLSFEEVLFGDRNNPSMADPSDSNSVESGRLGGAMG